MAPVVRGLYLASRVAVDAATRSLTLVDCFRAFRLHTPGAVTRPFALVAYLADAEGDMPAFARIARLDTMDEVYRFDTPLTFADRLTELRYVLRVNACVFPAAGLYQAELWVGGDQMAATPFVVHFPKEVGS